MTTKRTSKKTAGAMSAGIAARKIAKKAPAEAGAATCDYCGADLGCATGSMKSERYWTLQNGCRACDICLPQCADDFANLQGDERLWALRLRWTNGVSVDRIRDTLKQAEANGLASRLHESQLHESLQLFKDGEGMAAIYAAQAAWNTAEAVHNMMALKPVVLRDRVRLIGHSKGGRNKPRPAWHKTCVEAATAMLADGCEKHELVGKLRNRFNHNQKTIRCVLKKAGIK